VEQLADDAAVRDHHDAAVDVRGGNALEAGPHARVEVVVLLTVRDHVPPLFFPDAPEQRITGGGTDPEFAAFPVAEEHLAQVTFLDRLESEPGREWRRGLVGAQQRGDVDRVDALVRETVGEEIRLLFTDRIEGRIAVAVSQWEWLTGDGGC
jgi:hypothetical protein